MYMQTNIVDFQKIRRLREERITYLLEQRGYQRSDLKNTSNGYVLENENGYLKLGYSINNVMEFLDECMMWLKYEDYYEET